MPHDSVRRRLKDGRVAYGIMAAEFFTPGFCRIASNAGADFIMPETSNVGAAFLATRRLIAATDCVRAYPQLIAFYADAPFTALGMGGFGRSDARSARRPLLQGRHPPCRLAAFATEGQVSHERVTKQSPATASKWGRGRHVRVEGMQVSLHEHARVRLIVVLRRSR